MQALEKQLDGIDKARSILAGIIDSYEEAEEYPRGSQGPRSPVLQPILDAEHLLEVAFERVKLAKQKAV